MMHPAVLLKLVLTQSIPHVPTSISSAVPTTARVVVIKKRIINYCSVLRHANSIAELLT
jgi:hypothetical protein